jgi:hypothetical protein
MNGAPRRWSRQRVQAVALVVLLAASALEMWAVAGGLDILRDGLLALIALMMIVAAGWG